MNPSCTTHIMKRLAENNKVLYINPFSSDLLGSAGGRTRGLGSRIARKLKSVTMFFRRPAKNLYILSPIFLPVQGKRVTDNINNFLIGFQVKTICWLLGISNPILWIENVRAVDIAVHFKSELIVYHVSDLFSADLYTAHRQLQNQREKRVTETSDVVICVSRELYALKCDDRENVFYIPHGVDFDLFQEATKKDEMMQELAAIPRPIAGYFGTLTAYNDIELLEYCAKQLRNVSFVFAGQITGGDYSGLKRLDNVYFLGRIPYEKIPKLCASFDVCLLQWKMSDWIRCCNPLKMFEYMASGKPIVSVPIKETMQYSDIISIASSKDEFAEAIRWELQNDTPERSRKRIETAKNQSWDKHVEKISELIENTITAKQSGRFHPASQSLGKIKR